MDDLTEFQNSDGHWISAVVYEQALAEKEREIEYLNMRVDALRRFLCVKVEKTEQYQHLMAQAVRFAEAYRNAHLSNWLDLVLEEHVEEMATKDPVYVEARAFLKEHHGTQA